MTTPHEHTLVTTFALDLSAALVASLALARARCPTTPTRKRAELDFCRVVLRMWVRFDVGHGSAGLRGGNTCTGPSK